MGPIEFKAGSKTYAEALGIPKERAEELTDQFRLINHELKKPIREGEEPPTSDFILEHYIPLANNKQELVFCCFYAGVKTEEHIFSRKRQSEDDDDCDCENCVARRAAGIPKPEDPFEFLSALLKSRLK